MNVCIISGTLPGLRCGVGDYTHCLCSQLKEQNNIELNIITSQDAAVNDIEGIKVRPIVKKWSFSKLGLLLRSLKHVMPDVVHIQYPTQAYKNKVMINFFPLIFKLIFRQIPMVVTIHDAKTTHLLNKLRLVPFLFFAEKIITTTSEEKEYLVRRFPFLKYKSEVIHIGSHIKSHEFSQEEREKIRLDLGVEKNEILISHFGYILQKKKLEIIFYALKHLIDKGYRIKLAMISSFYPERYRYHARLKKIANQLDLNKVVIWTGYRAPQEVSKYLFSSDICVQIYQDGVSFRRGSFLAPLSHGLPIISTKVGNSPEGLKDHDNLLLVSPRDIDGLAEAIKELILSPDLRKRLGKNARALSERFSWKEIANEHFVLYQRVLGDKEGKR